MNYKRVNDRDKVIDMKKDDLLLAIDFQNVYLPEQEWACPTIRKALENTLDILMAESAPEYILKER